MQSFEEAAAEGGSFAVLNVNLNLRALCVKQVVVQCATYASVIKSPGHFD